MVQNSAIYVLFVDDDLAFLQTAKTIMLEIEPTLVIETASCADEALVKMKEKFFDAIISDYEMPQKNGLQFLEQLRTQNNQIPFILFTGRSREEIAIKALNLGADRYLNKQGNPETIFTELIINLHQLEQKIKSQKMLWESEERFKKIVTNIKDFVMVKQKNGKITYLSPSCKNVMSYEPEEFLEKSHLMIHPDDLQKTKQLFKNSLTEKSKDTLEYRIFSKEGKIKWISHSYSHVIENGELKEIVSVIRDITQIKEGEEEIEQKYETLEKVTESIDSGLAIIDKNYNVIWANSILKNRNSFTDKKCYQIFNTLNDVCPDCGVKKIFDNNLSFDTHEFRFEDDKGDDYWVELRATPVRDKKGNIIAAIELAIPISEQKKAQQALKNSEELYRMITENIQDVVTITDKNGIFTYVSPSAKNAFGFSPQEIIGKNAFDMTHPDDLENIVKPNLAILKKEGQTPLAEFRFGTKDGSYLWIENNAKAIVDNQEEMKILSVSRTVEKRKKAEKQLQIFAYLFDLISDTILVNDFEGNVVYFNDSAYKKMGYTKEEMEKMNLNLLEASEQTSKIEKRKKELLKKGEIFFETIFLTKDKKSIPVEINSKLINLDNQNLSLNVVRDIAERKKAQEQLTEVNEKLRVIGKLTRHDVRNKLSVININTYLLKKKIGENIDVKKYLDGIEAAVSTAGRLLDFSKLYEEIGAEEKLFVDVKKCFDEAVTLTPALGKIKIINQTSRLKVFADSLLRQIFYNLIDNSLKHGKKITKIKVHYKKFENHIELYYEDNGVGISTEDKGKLFIEGFSTSGGTGLGLPIIKKILQVYKWTIQEKGLPGKGTKFVIKIPNNTK